jgi:hypothetical protein
MFQKLLTLVSRLPLARWLKPAWKFALRQAVQLGGDKLQEMAKAQADAHLASFGAKVGPMVEDFRKRLDKNIEALPIPSAYGLKIEAVVDGLCENLQQRLLAASGAGSQGSVNAAIDGAFDAFQAQLISRIDAL